MSEVVKSALDASLTLGGGPRTLDLTNWNCRINGPAVRLPLVASKSVRLRWKDGIVTSAVREVPRPGLESCKGACV